MRSLYVLSFVIIILNAVDALESPQVHIQQGQLLGSWMKSQSGRNIASFEGIPYAKPPIGKYRFKEPAKPEPWIGIWDATKPGSKCAQIEMNDQQVEEVLGSEDCLFINVFTPKASEDANLPVVVFIHGGAFMFGSGLYYKPTFLLEKDLVMVTFNYRLNVFGFLSTEDNVVPGNMGLKDQSAALHWIKNNIRKFGGDPNTVTLSGLSAGGASVHYQMLSPLSKGTFQRAMAFSGSALCPWTLTVDPLQKAKALAAHVGCPTKNTEQMVECLRQRPTYSVLEAIKIFDQWKINLFSAFTPVVEPKSTANAFSKKHPYLALLDGDFAQIPFITSVTSEEGLYPSAAFTTEELLSDLEEKWNTLAPYIFVFNDTLAVSEHASAANKIKSHYMDGNAVSRQTFSQLTQALGDRHFVVDVQKTAFLHAAKSKEDVYFYHFKYRGAGSLSDYFCGTKENFGVSHGDDVFYIFDTIFMDAAHDDTTLEMSKLLVDLVESFTITGKPKVGSATWNPLDRSEDTMKYLEISSTTNLKMKKSKDLGQNEFWKNIGFKENEYLFSRNKEEL